MSHARETNFDGLVGPTHNYAGLSVGNLASIEHKARTSNPRAAALQGLKKMKFLADLGLLQGILPPHERPSVAALRQFGFTGRSDADVIEKAAREAPELLAACSSASFMWTANAATFSPSADSLDGRAHFTPANLCSKLHRSLEAAQTAVTIKAIFNNDSLFIHHPPLSGGSAMRDEGAANHTRLCSSYGEPGLQLFVYGDNALSTIADGPAPAKFPARQSLEASQAVARLHRLSPQRVLFARQNPVAIEAGVFHNDVISVGNRNCFLCHEQAFSDQKQVLKDLRNRFETVCGEPLHCIEVAAAEVSLEAVVASYLFNCQLISLSDHSMALIAPVECEQIPEVNAFLQSLAGDAVCPVKEVHFSDLRESMSNGGGPACSRLRVVLNEMERESLPPGIFLNDENYPLLVDWVNRHYRESLTPKDLADPLLLEECRNALDEICNIIGIGPIYPFQGATDA